MSNYFVSFPVPDIPVWNPVESQRRMLTLRQLADARQYQQMQMRRLEMQDAELERKRAAQERLRGAVQTLPPDADAMTMLRHLGPEGLPLIKELEDARTAGVTRQTTAATLRDKNVAAQRAVNQAIANIGMQAAKIADPAEREEFFNTGVASTLIDAGITPAEQFGAFPVPKDERMAKMAYANAYDPKALQEYEKAERDKVLSALTVGEKQWEQAGRMLGGVRGQPSWDMFRKSLPPELAAQLSPMFSPPELKRAQDMMLTAQQRVQQQPKSEDDFIRIAVSPDSTPEEQEIADKALKLYARKGAVSRQAGTEAQLRDDFRQESKNYTTIRDAWGRIQLAAADNTGAGDISLLYAYMRLLDPTSTIRESEFQLAQSAGSIPEVMRGAWLKAISGQRLDPNVKAQFISQAKKMYGQTTGEWEKIRDRYRGIAERSGANPENVVIDYSPAIPPSSAAQPGGGAQPATLGGIPNPLLNNQPSVKVGRDANGRLVRQKP